DVSLDWLGEARAVNVRVVSPKHSVLLELAEARVRPSSGLLWDRASLLTAELRDLRIDSPHGSFSVPRVTVDLGPEARGSTFVAGLTEGWLAGHILKDAEGWHIEAALVDAPLEQIVSEPDISGVASGALALSVTSDLANSTLAIDLVTPDLLVRDARLAT